MDDVLHNDNPKSPYPKNNIVTSRAIGDDFFEAAEYQGDDKNASRKSYDDRLESLARSASRFCSNSRRTYSPGLYI